MTTEIFPDLIIDFCTIGPMEHHDAGMSFAQYIGKRHALRGLGHVPDLAMAIESRDFGAETLKAVVNAGRWMVICPGCRTGVIACHHQPYFLCPGCGGRPEGKWVRVDFPPNRIEIETALLKEQGFRTNTVHRNWRPEE